MRWTNGRWVTSHFCSVGLSLTLKAEEAQHPSGAESVTNLIVVGVNDCSGVDAINMSDGSDNGNGDALAFVSSARPGNGGSYELQPV